MHLSILAGTTSKIVQIPVYDSSSTTGGMLTGLVFNTSSLVCWYNREGAAGAANQISLLTATKGTWTTAGFVAVDGTNMPGWYELHVPNAAVAAGAKSVSIELRGATNMVPVNILIELTAIDNQDAVRMGMTFAPNVASGSAGAIPTTGTGSNQISVSSGQVILQAGTGTGQLDFTSGVVKSNMTQVLGGACPAVSVTGVPKVDVQDIAGAAVSTSTAQLGVNAVNIGGTAAASATIGTVTTTTTATNLTNAPTSGDLTATMKTSVENAVWDAARSSHLATGVFGQIGQQILRDNTATAGASSTITLDAGASTTVDLYKGDVLYLYSGTGIGQSRVISAYSAGRVAAVVPAWVTTPDNTSKFILTAQRTPLVGTDTRILTSADVSASGETVAAVTGAVGSVTGAVGSVTGNVGGSVASVTARVTANTDQWAGTTIPVPAVTGVPKVDLVDIAGAAVSTSTAQLGVNAVQIGASVPGSATIGTVTTTTTATNLTNAPTAGDFTAAMKTSLNAATPASITGAVGSVTADVGITQAGADKVWSTTTRALTDKIGFALSSAGVQAIWDALTSALTTVGSIGKLLVTDIDGTISSRSTYAGGDTSGTTTLLSRLTGTRATNLDNLDAAISSRSVFASGVDTVTVGTNNDKTGYRLSATGIDDVWDEVTSGHTTAGTTGKALIDAGAAGDPWGAALPGSYGAGTAGAILGTNLDATVSSRSTYAGGDTSGTTTLLGRLTSTRAGNLDNLDAAITTRLATAGYTAPDNSDIAAIKAKTDNLPVSPAAVSDIPTASANASATWDAVRTSHTTSGTFGQGVSSVQGNVTGSAASVTADVGITQAGADKAWSTATRALTDKSGFALTSAYDPAKTAAQAGDAMALTTGERDSVAEAALKLDWTGIVGEASRSTLNALRFLRNKWSFTGTTLTVTAEDDTTSAWTGEVTTSSSAQPITSVDPT